MKICCKNCGREIKYNFNPFKNSAKINCKECGKVYRLKDINYNKKIYNFVVVPIVLILAVVICSLYKSTLDFIIRFILCVEFGDFIQYIFTIYSINKHGF